MNNRSFPAIKSLTEQVRQATADGPNPLLTLASAIRALADEGVDPYLIAGVLIEGAVHAVVRHVPPERQRETTYALVRLLVDRLMANGEWPMTTHP